MLGTDITTDSVAVAAVVLTTLIAVYTDFRKRLIENWLTLPAIAAGFLLNFIGYGWQGILLSGLGLLTGVGIFMLPFLFGRLGGGDVKLMGAIGALLGSYSALNVALYAFLAGGLLAIYASTLNKSLNDTINRVRLLTRNLFRRGAAARTSICWQSNETIPYGVAIGAGLLCFLVLGAIV